MSFSLRTLLIGAGFLAVLIGLSAKILHDAIRQGSHVQTIGKDGGSVLYDVYPPQFAIDAQFDGPDGVVKRHLRSALGDYLFGDVKSVTFSNRVITEEAASTLHEFPRLELLHFIDAGIDSGVAQRIGTLRGVRMIQIVSRRSLSEPTAILKALPRLPLLRCISIAGRTAFDDAALSLLGSCSNITHLSAFSLVLSTSSVKFIVKCPKLTTLWLESCSLGDGALNPLAGASALKKLVIRNCTTENDEVLQIAVNLTQLSELELIGVRITPKMVEHLSDNRNLRWLELDGGQITSAELKILRDKMVRCKVVIQQSTLSD